MLYMSISSEPPTVKDCRNVLNAKFLNKWSWRCFFLVFGATDPATAGHKCSVPTSHYQPDAGHGHLVVNIRWKVPRCVERQEFYEVPQATQHLVAMALSQPHQTKACHLGTRSVLHVEHSAQSLHWEHLMELFLTPLKQRGNWQISWRLQGRWQRPRTWSSSCRHGALYFSSRNSIAPVTRNQHQVISMEKLPRHTRA